ncbi:MAG: YihA family ribosome biogenesis GTP-binding protein [Gammaproteobacteria bacterium]|nr:MAG: YihA family ribosome biogenesis GTP-binding protein [Gammaproteobacteria bacterium]
MVKSKTVLTEILGVYVGFNYQIAKYMLGAADLKQLPEDEGVEVAFAGRSNAGKSSALNRLTNQRSLARTSKTPGRTQLINLFSLEDDNRLVDLPGYGFAKVANSVKQHWQKTLGLYLQKRNCLKGLVVLMDIRHPCKDMDLSMINWALQADLNVLVLLSKSDKLKQGARVDVKRKVKKMLMDQMNNPEELEVATFSATKGDGADTLRSFLDRQFEKKPDPNEEIG